MSVGGVTKNASALFVGKFISSIFGILFSFIIARVMLPSDFGLLTLGISTVFLILPFVNLGISESLIYFIPRKIKNQGDLRVMINKALGIKIVLGLIFSLGIMVFSGHISALYGEPELGSLLMILSLIALVYPIFLTLQGIFIGFQKMFYIMYTNISFSIVKFSPIIFFLVFGTIVSAAYGYALVYILSLLIALVFFSKIYPRGKERGKFEIRKFSEMSGGMFLASILANSFGSLLIILIGIFSIAEQAAFMEISFALGMLISFSAVALGTSLRPTVTELKRKETMDTIKRISKYMILSTVPLATLLISLRYSVVNFIYGSNYLGAISTVGWIAVVYCISGCVTSFYSIAQAMGKWRDLSITYLILVVVSFIMGVIWIPSEGSVGAAKGLVVAIIFSSLYIAIKFRKIGYPFGILSKSLIASGIMLVPILFVWNWTFGIFKVVLCGTLGLLTYVASIFLMKGLDPEDLNLLKKLFTKVRQKV